jgi:polyisoprenoid-binding protein YceI
MIRKLLFVVAGLVVLAHTALAADFKVDKAHTNVGFRVAHLVVAKTTGSFNDFDASFTYDAENMGAFSLTATIQAASIDTNVEQRDNHLRSSDFLDVANHPTITFTSTSLKMGADGIVVVGDLTIRGVTKQIELPITIVGPIQGPGGATVVGIEGRITINRHDFGVSWNNKLDNGSLIVSEEVRLEIDAEFIQQ